jgi:hypothetical protein
MKLNEKLGIPEGINKEADKLHKKLFISLDKFLLSNREIPKLDNDNKSFEVIIARYDIKINELHLKRVPFILYFDYDERVSKPTLMSAGYNSKPKYSYNDKSIFLERDFNSSELSINIKVNKEQNKSNIVNIIKDELNPKTLAHELMHLFDEYKSKKSNLLTRSEYSSYKNFRDFPRLIGEFMYLLYYTSSDENTVRPSELYYQILKNNIKRSEFLNYMKSNETIKILTKAEKFSMTSFKKELNDDDEVKEFVDNFVSEKNYVRIGDYANDILNILMEYLINTKFDKLKSHLDNFVSSNASMQDFINSYFGIPSDEVDMLNKKSSEFYDVITKNYKKYENDYNKYFNNLEKRLNFIGNKMKRKLYKLYDMIDDVTKKNEGFILNFNSFIKSEPTIRKRY